MEDNSRVHICFLTIAVNVLPPEFVECANQFICSYAHKVFHASDQLLIEIFSWALLFLLMVILFPYGNYYKLPY